MKTIIRIALHAAIALLVFTVTAVSAFTPLTGHWWNPNESGTGYNIDIYSGVLVVTVYTYKTNGESEWYLASGPMNANQHEFAGTLDKYRNGQCISCSYMGRPVLVGNDGAISINFLTETSATVRLPGGRITNIQPFFPAPAVSGDSLDGAYRLTRATVDYLGGPLIDSASGTLAVAGTMNIGGGHVTQTVTVTSGSQTVSLTSSGTLTDYGTYVLVVSPGTTPARGALIARGALLITERIVPAIGAAPPYSEVDQWALTVHTSATAFDKIDVVPADALPAPFGGEIGSILELPGLIGPSKR